MAWKDPTKFLKLPTKANPSAPINTAMAFDVNKPPMILINTETVCSEAILSKTLLFM